MEIKVLCHSSIKIVADKIIYGDPFKIKEKSNDADLIIITHSHYDHFSEEDIKRVKKEDTIICVTTDLLEKTINLGFKKENIVIVEPNKEYHIENIKIKTIPAYNINKKFHPKENNWVGYILEVENKKIYIAGDTDITEESKEINCDIALVPIGGTYTMNPKEAAQLINTMKPKKVIPTHYAQIVGKKEDAIEFKNLVNSNISVEIQI